MRESIQLLLTFDSPRFRFSEEDRAVDYFGQQLRAAGYNYFGNEPMYSGITGEEFHADIYLGVVYYQRLRHMVLDKFQCRTTGPVEQVTRQPVGVRRTLRISQSNEADYWGYREGKREVVSVSVKWSVMLFSHTGRRSCCKIDS